MNWSQLWTQGALAVLGAVLAYVAALLKDARDRIGTLETNLLKSRIEAYGDIWKLTGALNLFGQAHPVDCAALSEQFTEWYFSKGQMLTEESKSRYFLVQEVLNFYCLRNIRPVRPSGELLFSGSKRTITALREHRFARLSIPVRGNEGVYELGELESYVRQFKTKRIDSEEMPENAWLLLQFVMRAFRSGVIDELGSRADVRSRAKGQTRAANK